MLRGDPVLVSPVSVFGVEYLADIGWAGRPLLCTLPPRLRKYWKFLEVFTVFGTIGLAILELYLLIHQAFLSVGIPTMIGWGAWLAVYNAFCTRCMANRLAPPSLTT